MSGIQLLISLKKSCDKENNTVTISDNGIGMNLDEAIEHLKWVTTHSSDLALKATAHIRLARIYTDLKKYDEADAQLTELKELDLKGAAKGDEDYVAGMLALQKNNIDDAYAAFTAVVQNPETEKNLLGLAQIQLADLAK